MWGCVPGQGAWRRPVEVEDIFDVLVVVSRGLAVVSRGLAVVSRGLAVVSRGLVVVSRGGAGR
jgi:hypothetical protein